jgi:hypothetical protein
MKEVYRLSHLYLVREATGYRFVSERTGEVILQLEFVLADSMRQYFEQLFADRLHDGYLQLTDADVADIKRNHRSQIAA